MWTTTKERGAMSKELVTTKQTDSVQHMANAKGVGRVRFQKALDDGRFSRFLDGLKELEYVHEFRIHKDGVDVPALIGRLRPTYFVSEYAEAMMGNQEFLIGPKEDAVIRVYTCASLGVAGWSETDFLGPKGYEHVKQFGLGKCMPDDAQYVRIAHSKQELNEWIRFAHDLISAGGDSSVFRVGHGSGYSLCSDDGLNPGDLVALRLASPVR